MPATIWIFCAVAIATVTASYPSVRSSFRAVGSIYIQGTDGNKQITFEENYQHGTERSALTIHEAGLNCTVLEYQREKQAFLLKGDSCVDFSTKDAQFKTDIRVVKTDQSGQYILPIHQLLTLEAKYLLDENPVLVEEGGLKRNRWNFRINDTNAVLDIQADWSLPETSTASARPEAPLSFNIKRSVRSPSGIFQVTSNQVVTLNLFTHGEFNSQVFRPRRGIFCANRKEPNTFSFNLVNKLRGMKSKIEQVVKDYRNIGVAETWFDPENKLYRINYTPFKERVKNGVKRIVSHVQDVVYELAEARKCVVNEIKDVKDNFDLETIFNPYDSTQFDMEGFFGIGRANYNSVGETIERGIPCNLYQAMRSDWPPQGKESGKITTLWEWCLANQVLPDVQIEVDGFPLVSLNIYVKESPFPETESLYSTGLKLSYNFYDVRQKTSGHLDSLAFDIQQCFEDNNRKMLEFRAHIKDEVTRELLEKNERHKEHVEAWTNAILEAAKLKPGSLRVSSVQARVDGENLNVSFVLLGRHPSLPPRVQEIPLDDAVVNVQTKLDKNELAVQVELGSEKNKQEVKLTGEPGTLKSKMVEDESESKGKAGSGVSAGTMAAVAVVMLAVGVAIGSAFIFSRKRRMYQRV